MSVPSLSAILVTPDGFDSLRRTVQHIAAQSIRESIEVVIVAPSKGALGLDESELRGLQGVRIVEVGELRSNAHGYAAGVREATAPIVVFCEDHSYPGSEWAEALVEAHRDDFAVVGPVVANANPGSSVSWADFLLGYGPWLDPTPASELDYLPGHNSAYRRDLLMEYGSELDSWLEAESVVHWDLRSRGHRLYLEPRARTFHFNFSRPSSWIAATFHSARTFAARRVRDARGFPLRRLLYTLATPIIPPIRLRRCWRDIRRSEQPFSWFRLLPALTLSLIVSATGEAFGYALGPGDSPQRVSRYEFHRDRHVNERDRAAMAKARFWE